ncbi:MAG: hypothetical protein M4579_004565 [Chaenotheca gracillima]|nr:MAG: hypothetical protein M4579_004565 [Chaenotheca gracillima]
MPASVPSDEAEDPFTSLDISEDLVQSPSHKQAGTTVLDLNGLLPAPGLRLREDLSEGCGGQLWPAGIALAEYILRYQREELRGKKTVELGAGGGLVGLSLALAAPVFAAPLHLTDLPPLLNLMQHNISLNSLESLCQASVLSWGEESDPSSTPPPSSSPPATSAEPLPKHPDIILAADCVYFEPSFPLLTQTLQDMVGPNTMVYFCFKKRRKADVRFLKMVRRVLDVKEVDGNDIRLKEDLERWRRDGIFLYTMTKKG